MEIAVHQGLSVPAGSSTPRRVNGSAQPASHHQSSDEKKAEQQAQAVVQQESRIIQQLKVRDQEVRAHEAAHIAAGRPYIVSGPSYTYQEGPDGRNYAIGGEVQLDTSPVVNDPKATLEKAETVRRAALAPADPSSQDQRVASSATQTAAQARIEIAVQRREESTVEESEEEQMDSVEAADTSAEVAAEESAPEDATAKAVDDNQAEQKPAGNSITQAFAAEVPQPATINQFA